MKTLLFSFFFAVSVSLSAQNRVQILQSGQNIDNKISCTSDDEYLDWYYDYSYRITPAPEALKNKLNIECEYESAANKSVCMFQFIHLSSGRVDFGRTFLDAGYDWYHIKENDDAPWWYQLKKDTLQKNKLKKEIFGNSAVQELVYNWLLPVYKDAFTLMSAPEQQAFINMFRDGRAFADTFNLETQTRVVSENYNYADAVGSMNAFIYRRVANKEMTRMQIIGWIDRILNDIASVENKNPKEVDNYILKKHIGYDYYSAADFSREYGYSSTYRIMRKEKEQYSLLPTPSMYFPNYGEPESNLLIAYEGEEGSDFQCLFYCDSLGWNFTRLAFTYYANSIQMLGKGKSAHLYLVYDMQFEETAGDVNSEYYSSTGRSFGTGSIVDLDSGYVILDSVQLEQETEYTDNYLYDYRTVYPALGDKYVIYRTGLGGLYGIMDQMGNPILKPQYKTMEKTSNPEIVKVNGKKFIYAATGAKAPKVKEK